MKRVEWRWTKEKIASCVDNFAGWDQRPITIRFCRIWMGAWTSIYQQFWCSARYQGFDPADVSNLGGIFEYSVVLEITQHWMISLGLEEIRISVMYPPRIAVQNWDICWYLKHWKFTAGYPMATPTSWTPTGQQVAERPWWPSWLLSLENHGDFVEGLNISMTGIWKSWSLLASQQW